MQQCSKGRQFTCRLSDSKSHWLQKFADQSARKTMFTIKNMEAITAFFFKKYFNENFSKKLENIINSLKNFSII